MKLRALRNIGSHAKGDTFDTTEQVGDFLLTQGAVEVVKVETPAKTEPKITRRSKRGGGGPVESPAPTAG